MLYLVATPIGNLKDISLRAIEVLKSVDLILCEDTRVSGTLCKEYGIEASLRSFHKFSESKLEESVIGDLGAGKNIALISDAGTPGINDPGQRLVERCHKEGIEVTSIPGPSAPILALTLSGLSLEKFQFVGFLPKKAGERKGVLIDAFFYKGVTVCFESPNRIQTTLQEIAVWGAEQEIAVCREMTKKYEEVLRGKASDLLGKEMRGEIVLIIQGGKDIPHPLGAKEHVEKLQAEYDLSKQEALKLAATLRGESKKDIYRCIISD
ncbi:MAG: 16S rRNA (cytidine(1402)-2'-O)-methyltransferase [Simkaniaceae bacterium]|nr:16S rRNA (cytidine(1402)-2'-O)-methyltransferase [Candidatus Sacchlamyda saccharinae]